MDLFIKILAFFSEIGKKEPIGVCNELQLVATDVQQIRRAIIEATSDIRRKMTQKYQVEF